MCSQDLKGAWQAPKHAPLTSLQLYNTLTKTKVPFVTQDGTKQVTWYSCGPTVYDAAHIGHARNYVTFDIIRRVVADYFGYDVFYVMNITDIDDKIILRARQAHLLKQFRSANATRTPEFIDTLWEALVAYAQTKLSITLNKTDIPASVLSVKAIKLEEEDAKGKMHQGNVVKALEALLSQSSTADQLITVMEDVLAPFLDDKQGASVTEHGIFKDLAMFWERDFLEDMRALNVLEADVKTRVSEFVPQIIDCIEGIMRNGYGYEAAGSVYFDVAAFSRQHAYAKLCPQHAGNSKFFEEGEGSLGVKLAGKRDPRDFALWKCSKPGEPRWESPWGLGRPGWHIECSAMAGSVVPGTLDVHSGGIDLAFPHHDNEMAQSEAFGECQQWVNYFLHAGHVHIEGHKMSKSLKNFITIKDALRMYSARQLRLMFLQHAWNQPLTYKESAMSAAVACEQTFVHFFAGVAALLREIPFEREHHWTSAEASLSSALEACQQDVHEALSDSIDTPRALSSLLDLVATANVYLKESKSLHPGILAKVARYATRMLRVFGVASPGPHDAIGLDCAVVSSGSNTLKIAETVSKFRDSLRTLALAGQSDKPTVLKACDDLRDALANEGVLFEDRTGQGSIVKLVSAEQVAQLRQEQERQLQDKLAKLAIQRDKQEQKRRQAQIDPATMFRDASALYSQWDCDGVPTHDHLGVELSKNSRKKLQKEQEAQRELHAKFLDGKL